MITNQNQGEPGDGGNRPVPSSRTGQKRRRERSPLHRLTTLLALTYRQPGRLPTPEQASELERLLEESKELLAYRASHPNWRAEEKWK